MRGGDVIEQGTQHARPLVPTSIANSQFGRKVQPSREYLLSVAHRNQPDSELNEAGRTEITPTSTKSFSRIGDDDERDDPGNDEGF